MFHSSTLDRRVPFQSHAQTTVTTPPAQSQAPPTQQEVDSDMVEILIWSRDPPGTETHLLHPNLWLYIKMDRLFHYEGIFLRQLRRSCYFLLWLKKNKII